MFLLLQQSPFFVARNIEAYILGEVAAAVVSDDVADIL
jgi:hypothetical protein